MAIAKIGAALSLASCLLVSAEKGPVVIGGIKLEPEKFAKQVVKKFTDEGEFPKDRDNLAAIRQTEINGGSSGSDRKYQYLSTSCMQQRAEWAAEKFKEQGCKRVLEVGGFHTPLPKIVEPEDIPDVELYVDVDPSADKSKVTRFGNHTFPSVSLQIILDEFRAHKKKDKAELTHMGIAFDCFLMLGTTAQNVGDEPKKKALKDAVAKSKIAIIEYPSSNPDTPGHFMSVMQDAGMTKSDVHQVDCKDDSDAISKKGEGCGENNACLTRNMVVFTRGAGKETKKSKEGKNSKGD